MAERKSCWRPTSPITSPELKPEVKYTNGTLVVRQPETEGLPALRGITDFRNEWDLRLNNETPMDLQVDMGAGTSDLQLAGLSLTGLDVSLGASESTIDLSGDWARDLEATIDAGATDITRAAAQGRWRPPEGRSPVRTPLKPQG